MLPPYHHLDCSGWFHSTHDDQAPISAFSSPLQSLDSLGTSEDTRSKRHSTSDLSDVTFSDVRKEGWLHYKQILTKKGKVCTCWTAVPDHREGAGHGEVEEGSPFVQIFMGFLKKTVVSIPSHLGLPECFVDINEPSHVAPRFRLAAVMETEAWQGKVTGQGQYWRQD